MSLATAPQALIAAVTLEDTDEIHNQLNAGAEINTRDDKGYTLLQNAIRGFKNDAVAVLLERGADPEIPATIAPAYTALHIAAQCANEAATKLLLQYQNGPDIRDDANETPLHVAAQAGAVAIARLLVEAGAEIMPKDGNKETPRDVAARLAAQATNNETLAKTALYLQTVEQERGIDRESEQARREKVAGDITVLKSFHPERYKIKMTP
jgi:ankyrin repeat protein